MENCLINTLTTSSYFYFNHSRNHKDILLVLNNKHSAINCFNIVITTFPISYVKQLFHNGQPTRDDDCKNNEGMISTSPFGTLDLKMKIHTIWKLKSSLLS